MALKIKEAFRHITPPVLLSLWRKLFPIPNASLPFKGNYNDWQQAVDDSTGFDSHLIFEKVKNAALKVKNGTAVYEKDSIIFDYIDYSWPVLASLLKTSISSAGSLQVIDFGGSLGTTYRQNKTFLDELPSLSWNIVEQKHFVDCGKQLFEDDKLKFYYTIEEAMADKKNINCLLISGVYQYLEKPVEWCKAVLTKNIQHIIFDRTSFIADTKERIMVQNVPEHIYKAKIPCWFFIEEEFLQIMKTKYELVAYLDSHIDKPLETRDGKKLYYKGFYFTLKPSDSFPDLN